MTRTWVVVSTRDSEVVTTIVLADNADAAFVEACEMWTEKEQVERHLVAVVQVDGKVDIETPERSHHMIRADRFMWGREVHGGDAETA